ncbi:MAG: helix-turn-helix transcriptional regulator [Candidatus Competibacteraceae bacterium]|nr:helix-turn-helix transcriptional regulator [Candidatus Competibacteraceae bacterium]
MTTFTELLHCAEQRDDYWAEHAKLDFAIDLKRLMDRQQLRKTDLATRLGVSPAYITRVMRGDANLTIDSMVRLARAAGGTLHLHIASQSAKVRWFDVLAHSASSPKPEKMASQWAKKACQLE